MIDRIKPLIRRAASHVPMLEKQRWRSRSYSQEGEDLILARFFGFRAEGFYVDVGAHHPLRFSNTQIFYDRGWSGVNIDAMPGSMTPFRTYRPRDVNVEAGVGGMRGTLKFHVFDEPAVNTFDPAMAKLQAAGAFTLRKVVDVDVLPLGEILNRHVPAGREIDFLSVDVEGHDLQVLQSNDWIIFRPKVILAESLLSRFTGIDADPVALFLADMGYEPFAKTVNTLLFVRRDA